MFFQNFNSTSPTNSKKSKNVNVISKSNNGNGGKNKKNHQSSPVIKAVTPPPPQVQPQQVQPQIIESFSTPFVTLKPLNFNTSSLASSAAIASVTVTTTTVPPSPTVPKLLSPTPINTNVGVIGELLVSNLSSAFSSSNTTPSTSPLSSPNKFYSQDTSGVAASDNNANYANAIYSRSGSSSTSPSSFLSSSSSSVGTRSSFSSSSDEDEKFNYSPTFSNLNSNFDDLSNLFTSSLCMLSNLPPLQQQPQQVQQIQHQQQIQQQQQNNYQQQIILPPPSLPHQQCAIQENIRNVINYLGCCFRFGQISKNTLVEYLDMAFNDFGVSAEYFAKRSMEKDAIMPDQYCALVEINVENLLGELVNFSMKRHYYSFARKYSCLDARSYFDDYIEGTIIKLILDEIRNTNDYGTLLVDNEKFNEIYTDGIIYFNDSELINSKGIIPSEAMPSSHITEHILCKKDSKNAINYFNYLIHGSVKLIIGKIEYTCIGSTHILPNRKLCGSLKNKFLNAFAIHQQTVNSTDANNSTASDSLSNYYYQQQLQNQQINNSIGGSSSSSNGNNGITSNPKEFSSKLYALKTVIMTAFYYHLYHFSSSNFVLHK